MSIQLTQPIIVPEYGNARIKAYIPDASSGLPLAVASYTVDLQAIVNSLFPGENRIARANACLLLGNDLFVSNSSDNSQCIFKLPNYLTQPDQAVREAFVLTLDGGGYVGMAADAAGDLYTSEQVGFDNQLGLPIFHIVRYSGTGKAYPGSISAAKQNNYSSKVDLGPLGPPTRPSFFANLVFDAAGNLWVSDYQNHRVAVIRQADLATPNAPYRELGNLQAAIPVANSVPALQSNASYLFAEPEGLDFDGAGNLWVANNNDGGAGGVNNARTSLVKLTPTLQSGVLERSAGASFPLGVDNSNQDFFIYQVPNLANDAGSKPQFGGLQIDRAAGRLYVNEEVAGNGRGYDLATIASIGTVTAVNDLSIVSTNPGNGGLALLRGKAPSLCIRDTLSDTGAEPDATTTRPWESPDIWPRIAADGSDAGPGSVAESIPGGALAHIYVRVTNHGLTASDAGQVLRLYWAKANAGPLSIPQPWDGNGPQGAAGGGMVAMPQTLPSIAPGQSQLVHLVWAKTPNPIGPADDGHFCLLAQITDPAAAPFAGFPPAMLAQGVLAMRTAAWRNIHIDASMQAKSGRRIPLGMLVASNFTRRPMNAQLLFEVLDASAKPVRRPNGRLLIAPRPAALARVQEHAVDRAHFEAADGGAYRLDIEAGIPRLRMEAGESFGFGLTYVPDETVEGLAVRVSQYSVEAGVRTLVGGQTFVVGQVKGFTVPQPSPSKGPVTTAFDSYTLSYRSGHPSLEARIYCWQGTTRVGTIDFLKEGAALPANFYDGQPGGWGVYINHPLSRFSDVMTLLRYEKPLHLYFTPDTLDAGIITSEHEPVGEQE